MLSNLEIGRRESPLSHSMALPLRPDHQRSNQGRLKKATKNRLSYLSRKAVGLCSAGRCPTKAEPDHTYCRKHLQAMAERASKRSKKRLAQGLCVYCGERPGFWGRKCIFCRQLFGDNPLPQGARRALRLYRQAEARRRRRLIQSDVRKAVRNLLSMKEVKGRRAEALRIYAGIDDGKWRTYKEVAQVMNISIERVRQLLLPSKVVLNSMLGNRAPWSRAATLNPNEEGTSSQSIACALCNDIGLRRWDHESDIYEDCGLPGVLLGGLPVDQCQSCHSETVSIPRIPDLQRKMAEAILLKPVALTGQELRFLRTVAGLSTETFAERLGVTFKTVRAWERSNALSYLNDLGARMVIAILVGPTSDWSPIFKILSSIKTQRSAPIRLSAKWISEAAQWIVTSGIVTSGIVTSVSADDQRQPALVLNAVALERQSLPAIALLRLQRMDGQLDVFV